MKTMHIQGWPVSLPIKRGTLLESGLREGVPIPNQCRSGECGRCKCRLVSGKVQRLGHVADALSKEEEANKWILACRSKAKTDVEIHFPKALGSPILRPENYIGQVVDVKPLTHDVIRLRVQTRKPPMFYAGQYFELNLQGYPNRSYSPANAPGSKQLDFFVKILRDGRVSNAIANHLTTGSCIRLRGPYGNACISESPTAPIILAAGVTGLSPILSILRCLAQTAPLVNCDLYFGVRTKNDLFADDELTDLAKTMPGLRIFKVFSDELNETLRSGLISSAIAEDHQSLQKHLVFVAGPPTMVDSVQNLVLTLGVDEENLFADKFTSSPPSSFLHSVKRFFKWRGRSDVVH